MNWRQIPACALALAALAGCSDDVDEPPAAGKTSVLLIILDDVGSVSLKAYSDYWGKKSYKGTTYKPTRVAPTPNIDKICARGVRFVDAWSNPTCSPTRAAILTGRFGFRTGIGEPCSKKTNSIGVDEPSLPSVIKKHAPDYKLGSVGKWHLGTSSELGGDKAPNTMGWDHYVGILGGVADYYSWPRTVNGVTATSTSYATTKLTDDAISFLGTVAAGQPFLLWLAYNAPHTPLHLPPASLHSYDKLPSKVDAANSIDYFEAMLEAADTELGRLLKALPDADGDGLPDDTLVIVMGDNGTLNGATQKVLPPPFDTAKGKGSIYEHGVRIPLCVAGRGVTSGGRDADALVHVADIYRTILEAAGVDAAKASGDKTSDSVSLTPYLQNKANPKERGWIMTEQFKAAGSPGSFTQGIAIKSKQYKFVRTVKPKATLAKYLDECFGADNLIDDTAASLYGGTDKTATAACDKLRDTALGLVCQEKASPWATWCP